MRNMNVKIYPKVFETGKTHTIFISAKLNKNQETQGIFVKIQPMEAYGVPHSKIYRIVFTANGFERTIYNNTVIIFKNDFCSFCDDEFALFRNYDIIYNEYRVTIPDTFLISRHFTRLRPQHKRNQEQQYG
jgi:hypothetical protein